MSSRVGCCRAHAESVGAFAHILLAASMYQSDKLSSLRENVGSGVVEGP